MCIQGYFVNKFLAIVNQITQVHIHIDHDLDALIWNNFVEGYFTAKLLRIGANLFVAYSTL
jgi:hypothetical protein